MKSFVLTFLFAFFFLPAFSQVKSKDMVVMKNGDRLSGEITYHKQGEKTILRRKDGSEVTILDSEISHIVQEPDLYEPPSVEDLASVQKVKEYIPPKSKGIYNISQLSFAMGSGNDEGLALGAGISTILGKQISPLFGIGLGVGFDNYARRGETIYPVFLDLRSYLPIGKNHYHYYLNLNGGYGFAFDREKIGINEADGGYMFQAAIGYRAATKEGVDMNVDAGVKFQQARFSRDLFNGDVEVRDLVFQRFNLRVGIGLWGRK